MPLTANQQNTFLNSLSAFWTRLFKDSGTLKALYEGAETLVGQAYLDLLNNVLTPSVLNTPLYNSEYFRLILIRETDVVVNENRNCESRFVHRPEGDLVSVPILQNKVVLPTAELEDQIDYDFVDGQFQFVVDPTDYYSSVQGFGRRALTLAVGNKFSATSVADWTLTGAGKGDTLRVLSGMPGTPLDYPINLVRSGYLVGEAETPFPDDVSGVTWVVVRELCNSGVVGEILPDVVLAGNTINLNHTHVIQNTLSISARRPTGERVVEGVDYTVDYITGVVTALTTWLTVSLIKNTASYRWMIETVPESAGDGAFGSLTSELVNEVSFWAPDIRRDKFNLAYHYGYLLDSFEPSSETYRDFLRGIMQLFMLGPALERLEAGLNVTVGFPVIRDDDEVLVSYDDGVFSSGANATIVPTGNLVDVIDGSFSLQDVGATVTVSGATNAVNNGAFNVIDVLDSSTLVLNGSGFIFETGLTWQLSRRSKQRVITSRDTYEFPLEAPIRDDVKNPANFNVLTFDSFEPLTTAFRVVDYIQDENWWHETRIPPRIVEELEIPARFITTKLFRNVINPADGGAIGDLGFYIGADEEGQLPATPTTPVYRHTLSFLLMDQYLKYHTFNVEFDENIGVSGGLLNQLASLIDEAKPAYTTAFVSSITEFLDEITIIDDGLLAAPSPTLLDSMPIFDSGLIIGGTTWDIGDYTTWRQDLAIPLGPSTAAGSWVDLTVTPGETVIAAKITADVTPLGLPTRNVASGVDYEINYTTNRMTRLTDWDNSGTAAALIVKRVTGTGNLYLSQVDIVIGGTEPNVVRSNPVGNAVPSISDHAVKITVRDVP